MNEPDWFRGMLFGFLGLIIGPIIAWLVLAIPTQLFWPRGGETTIAASMIYLWSAPAYLLSGLVLGPLAGLIWGLDSPNIIRLLNQLINWMINFFRR